MRLDFLLQFIVPLTFLAIWALTSLLNRDAQPLPPRPGTGRAPGLGPARGAAPGGFSPSSRSEFAAPTRATSPARPAPAPMVDRAAPTRWSTPTAQPRPGSIASRAADEGIVILESETRPTSGPSAFSPSASASSRAARPSTRRAATRARSAPAAPIKPIEPDRPRALTGLAGQSLASKKARPLDIAPLSTPISSISSTPLTSATPTPAPEVARTAARPDEPSLSVDQLRAMLASPRRVREVALLGELLQPPVALRPPRRTRG